MLGVEALNGGTAMHAFVQRQLHEMSHHVGMYSPLTAKSVLERFWASGETSWDACFDTPHLFCTQMAINVARVVSPVLPES
ncbi:hypothetical protein A1O1_05914 [Capronia coronata CBS 617.96]|uniref:Uncharacterized protein n=1 Tax=Capronia coronata CBS 617.96 TaxID=1182541 RepID=W9Y7E7_9EURO|nr:uncharacterized protein A1O1_05914 [Capronia coronata CBS 617.96]EXJ85550.1 hypothetical protein A1O1_05914 [Capronia coronata CBS 617.96]